MSTSAKYFIHQSVTFPCSFTIIFCITKEIFTEASSYLGKRLIFLCLKYCVEFRENRKKVQTKWPRSYLFLSCGEHQHVCGAVTVPVIG